MRVRVPPPAPDHFIASPPSRRRSTGIARMDRLQATADGIVIPALPSLFARLALDQSTGYAVANTRRAGREAGYPARYACTAHRRDSAYGTDLPLAADPRERGSAAHGSTDA